MREFIKLTDNDGKVHIVRGSIVAVKAVGKLTKVISFGGAEFFVKEPVAEVLKQITGEEIGNA